VFSIFPLPKNTLWPISSHLLSKLLKKAFLFRKFDWATYVIGNYYPKQVRQDFFNINWFNVELMRIPESTKEVSLAMGKLEFWNDSLKQIYLVIFSFLIEWNVNISKEYTYKRTSFHMFASNNFEKQNYQTAFPETHKPKSRLFVLVFQKIKMVFLKFKATRSQYAYFNWSYATSCFRRRGPNNDDTFESEAVTNRLWKIPRVNFSGSKYW